MIKAASWRPVLFYPVPFSGKRLFYGLFFFLVTHIDGNPAKPDIHDIGIVASFDPVAIDQACIDLAFAAEGSKTLQDRVNSRDGLRTLEHAEEIGLGSRTYELVNIDE